MFHRARVHNFLRPGWLLLSVLKIYQKDKTTAASIDLDQRIVVIDVFFYISVIIDSIKDYYYRVIKKKTTLIEALYGANFIL